MRARREVFYLADREMEVCGCQREAMFQLMERGLTERDVGVLVEKRN